MEKDDNDDDSMDDNSIGENDSSQKNTEEDRFTPRVDIEINSNELDKGNREENKDVQRSNEDEANSAVKNAQSSTILKEDVETSTCGILCVSDPSMFRKLNSPMSDYFIAIQGVWIPNGKGLLIILVNSPQECSEKKMLWDYLYYVIGNWNGEVSVMGDFNEVRFFEERFGSIFNKQGAEAFNSFITLGEGLMEACPNISAITLDRYLSDHRPILLREVCVDYGLVPFRFYHYWFELKGFDKFMEDVWNDPSCSDPNAILRFMKKLKHLKHKIRNWIKAKKDSCSDPNAILRFMKVRLKDILSDIDVALDKGDINAHILSKCMNVTKDLQNLDMLDSLAHKLAYNNVGVSLRRCPRGGAKLEQFTSLMASLEGYMLPEIQDKWVWSLMGSGEFSVALVRRCIDDHLLLDVSSKTRWLKAVLIKVNIHAWKVKLDSLPTRFNLSHRGLDIQRISCPICDRHEVKVHFIRDEEAAYLNAFTQATLDEERYLKQKAKIECLRVGDTNSGYFHRSVKAKVSRSRIDCVTSHDNVLYEGKVVPSIFVDHYKVFLGSEDNFANMNGDGLFMNKLHSDKALFMVRQDIVGEDVCNAVKDFFSNGQILWEINHTIIALLPKEHMHKYHLNHGPPRCAFKIEIQKAFNTVSWKFLNDILMGFGFHNTMIKWIMACITSTSYSINVNGELHGYFKGKRGLRQGDPMSPYLFILVMEILTLMLKRRIHESGDFGYHNRCSKQKIINICFADDLIMFSGGDIQSAKILIKALEEFKCASDLVPSIPKSTVFFCNVVAHVKLAILHLMPFEEGSLPIKYLGVPLISSRLVHRDCKILVEHVQKRIGD
ncbi:polypyrimidine tract-binding protein homolog 2 isoform X1 [Tanacetum coccineum]